MITDDLRDELIEESNVGNQEESLQEHKMLNQGHHRCHNPDDRPPLCRTINTISEGFVGGGRSSSFGKKNLRAAQSVHAIFGSSQRRMSPITFSYSDFQGTDRNQEDPMVIIVEVENFAVKKVLIDQGSSVDILCNIPSEYYRF